MTDERQWFEVHLVVRTTRERLDQAQAWLEDMGLAEINRIDVLELDEDLRRWDGGRPPGVVVVDELAPAPTLAQFDLLRQGHELHEQPRPGDPTLDLLERE